MLWPQNTSLLKAILIILLHVYVVSNFIETRHQGPVDEAIRSAITALQSPKPPPLPSGIWHIGAEFVNQNIFMHPQVREALAIINQATPKQYSILAEHFRDDTYSYSMITSVLRNFSVGEVLQMSIAQACGNVSKKGYKSRETQHGLMMQPNVGRWMNEVGVQKWIEQQSGKSIDQLRSDYAYWYRAQEIAAGFISDQQRYDILGSY